MKKFLLIIALFVLALSVQSCCVTASCPGVAEVEAEESNS